MRFELYLAVGGEHFAADEFNRLVGLPNTAVKRIGQRGEQLDPIRFRAWTIWESERIAGSNEPGDDVVRLLAANRTAISLLSEPRWAKTSRWVAIVGYYRDEEGPRGFSFDEKAIKSVADIGASIKVDTVVDPAEILKHTR